MPWVTWSHVLSQQTNRLNHNYCVAMCNSQSAIQYLLFCAHIISNQIKSSTVARKNSLERPKPRKKPREEPSYVGWPVLFWLCRVEIITEHGQDVQMFIDDQQGQIIIITVVVEGATGQQLRSKCQFAFHSRSLGVSLPLLLFLERWKQQVWDR